MLFYKNLSALIINQISALTVQRSVAWNHLELLSFARKQPGQLGFLHRGFFRYYCSFILKYSDINSINVNYNKTIVKSG